MAFTALPGPPGSENVTGFSTAVARAAAVRSSAGYLSLPDLVGASLWILSVVNKRLAQAFAWLAVESGIGVVTGEPGVGKTSAMRHLALAPGQRTTLTTTDPARHEAVIEGLCRWTAPGGAVIVKYCLEIAGRGRLVEEGLVPAVLARAGYRVDYVNERSAMKLSHAGLLLRTGTAAAVRPKSLGSECSLEDENEPG